MADIGLQDAPARGSLADGTAEEVAAVFDVLPAVVDETRGVITLVTRVEAACLEKLAVVTLGVRPWMRYLLARAYSARQHAGLPATDLDALVAFRPWSGEAAADAYYRAIALGHIPPPPRYLDPLNHDVGADWERSHRFRAEASRRARAAARPYVDDALALLVGQPGPSKAFLAALDGEERLKEEG